MVCCLLLVVRRSLFVVCSSLFVVCGLLLVVCCLMVVVCWCVVLRVVIRGLSLFMFSRCVLIVVCCRWCSWFVVLC